MNKINFANSGPSNLHKATKRATVISALIFTTTIVAILILQIKQWQTLKKVKAKNIFYIQQTKELDTAIKEKISFSEKKELLKKKIKKINQLRNTPQVPFSLFTSISDTIGTTGVLKSLSITKKNLGITITYPTIKKATRFMQRITELPSVLSLDIDSIKPDEKNLCFKIRGKLC